MLAGICIGLGAVVYLSVGGPMGAVLFSIGLITVLTFKLKLFTGKAYLLSSGDISGQELFNIWFMNFFGAFLVALVIAVSRPELGDLAKTIVQMRNANGELINMFLGIGCGFLMTVAVKGFQKTGNYLFVVLPVAVFILSGFNHCVADMFYIWLGADTWRDFLSLIPTTIGNIIGCNLICFKDTVSFDG